MSPRAAWRLESLGFARVYDYVPGKTDWLAACLPRDGTDASVPLAGDAAREAPTCHFRARVAEVRARVEQDEAGLCVAVNDAGIVMGVLERDRLGADDDAPVEALMTPDPTTVRASEPLAELAERMREADVEAILVTTPEGRLIGLLRRAEAEPAAGRFPG
jgi:CBS domain-containing protein